MQAKLWGSVFVDPEAKMACQRHDTDDGWQIVLGSVSVHLSEDQVLRLSQLLANVENEILDGRPVVVDAFINTRPKTVRALSRGDWVNVDGWVQIVRKEHGHPASTLWFADGTPFTTANDACLTTGDRVTDCEGSVMPESSDAWDVLGESIAYPSGAPR